MISVDEAVQNVANWRFVDGETYHWWRGSWWLVEFWGTAPNQYRHIEIV